MSAPRLEGMRALRDAVQLLDDEHLLDQHARDRLIAAFCGELRKELDAAHSRRFFLKLRGVA